MAISGVNYGSYFPSFTLDYIGEACIALSLFHLFVPKYSPYLKLQGCELFDEKQFADNPALVKKVKKVQAKIEKFRQQMKISSPVELLVKNGSICLSAQGLSGIPGITSPVIAAGTDLFNLKDDELDPLLCHELAHIKNLDTVKLAAWMAAAIAVATFATPFFIGLSATALAVCDIGLSALVLASLIPLSRAIEKKADLDAAETLGTAKGIISLFERAIAYQKEIRKNSWLDSQLISPEGNVLLDFLHPSLTDRVAYLRDFERARLAPATA